MGKIDALAVFDALASGRSMTIGELMATKGVLAELMNAACDVLTYEHVHEHQTKRLREALIGCGVAA